MFKISLILLLWFACSMANNTAVFGSISGFVYEQNSGEGMIGANVFLRGTSMGASTNVNGYYSIPRVPPGEYTLVCHYIGYRVFAQKIQIKPGTRLSVQIKLAEEAIQTEEIVVSADSMRTIARLYDKDISSLELQPRELQRVPQVAETDLLRSLQMLPGILPISDFSSELYVRGGTPDQNLYLIDGADVYNPEHFFGLFSTFNTDAIKNVEISKGGFGAEYGGRLSSILSVTNLDGNRNEFEGSASISLLSAKTTLQMPLGKAGSISGSFRRTYFDQTIARALEDIPDYYFWDGHLKTFLDLDERNKLTLSFYSGQDDLDFKLNEDGDEQQEVKYAWGNNTGSLRWTHIFSPGLFSNFWITGSTFRSDFNFEFVEEENKIDDVTFKGNLEYFHSEKLSGKFGFEVKNLGGSLVQEFPGGLVDVQREMQHYIGYLQTKWNILPLLEMQAGLRYNFFKSGKSYQDLSPRLSLKYRLTETTNLKAAFGNYHQYLFKIPRTFFVDIWTNADENYRDASAYHYVAGFQKEIRDNYQFEAEAYYKDYTNIYNFSYFFYVDLQPSDYTPSGEPIYRDSKGLFDQGNGESIGIEFLLKKDTGIVSGWLSYTLGKTVYTINGINQNKPFPPRHDRHSTLNLIGNIDARNAFRALKGQGKKDDKTTWRLGIGLVYASGQPITTTSSVYFTTPLPDQLYDNGLNLYPTFINSLRLPAYARFDLSLTMQKRYNSWTLSPFMQIFNAGNRKNVWFIEYDRRVEGNRLIQEINTVSMFPILPTLGVNVTF